MADMVDVIKQVAINAVNAGGPMALLFAKVDSLSPIKITIEQRLSIPSAFIVVTETANTNIAVGDTVIVIRQQGGQRYVILDKVVD